jgi:hypothetical protein
MAESVDDGRLGAGAVKVDIGRGSRIVILIGVPLGALLSACSVYAALDARDRATAVIGYSFAAFFAVPVLISLAGLRRLLRPRGLAFDGRGVHYWEGGSWTLLGWEDIAAVGIGYEQPPEWMPLRLGQRLGNEMLDALKIERRRRIAVEIFPAHLGAIDRHPRLTRFRREQQAPDAKLSPVRWRFPLPPAPGLAARVGQGVEAFQPARWLGWFARPWRGGFGA